MANEDSRTNEPATLSSGLNGSIFHYAKVSGARMREEQWSYPVLDVSKRVKWACADRAPVDVVRVPRCAQ